MGTEVGADELTMNEDNLSPNTPSISKIPDENCGIVDSKNNVIVLPQSSTSAANQTPTIVPVTPDSNRENGEVIHDLSPTPVLVSSPPNVFCFNSLLPTSPNSDNSQTPKESVFDSFDPGRQYLEELATSVVQRLNFVCTKNLIGDIDHESNGDKISDEGLLFESLYSTVLDSIFSEHTSELVTEVLAQVSDSDGLTTPKFAPRLSWVAETCPGAPVKPTSKFRNFDIDLCRKLEF